MNLSNGGKCAEMITNFYWLNTGYTTGMEWVTKGRGRWKKLIFPAYCGLLKDDSLGYILFDTGYGPDFRRATRKLPYRLYRWATPVYYDEGQDIVSRLRQIGITPDDVGHIFISHLHADHIGHLKAFTNARYICHSGALDLLRYTPFRQVRNGFLPELLPQFLTDRLMMLENDDATHDDILGKTWPLFGGLLEAVELPGHARGQTGLIFSHEGKRIFLVADACWFTSSITTLNKPHGIVSLIVDDWKAFGDTLARLHKWQSANPDAVMIPSHCTEHNYPFKID